MTRHREVGLVDSRPLVLQHFLPTDALPAPAFRASWRATSRLRLSRVLRALLVVFAVVAPAALAACALGWLPSVVSAGVTVLDVVAGVGAVLLVLDTAMDYCVGGLHAVAFAVGWWAVLGTTAFMGLGREGLCLVVVFAVHGKLAVVWLVHVLGGLLIVPGQLTFGGFGGWWPSSQSFTPSCLLQWRSQLEEELHGQTIALRTPDGAVLDTMWFPARHNSGPRNRTTPQGVFSPSWRRTPPDIDPLPPLDDALGSQQGADEAMGRRPVANRVAVMFNSNNEAFELKTEEIDMFLARGWNVLAFNYRGVGRSKGCVYRDGLVLDGDTCYQYVRRVERVADHNIVLVGTSLGGAVAAEVASMHPGVSIVNDRSFASLRREILHAAPAVCGAHQGGLKGRLLGHSLGVLACFVGWELNAAAAWRKITGDKLVVYHDKDHIIPANARLCRAVDVSDPRTRVMRLDEGAFEASLGDPDDFMQVAHGRSLTLSEQQRFFAVVNAFCGAE